MHRLLYGKTPDGDEGERLTGGAPPVFPFHYGREAEQYTFYRVPKILFTSPVFKTLSAEAKLLYGIMLDRMQLSIRNGWLDEEGKVYIYFTIEKIMEALACGNKKAGRLLSELDDRNGIGLVTRVRQGLGKPDKLFIHKCISAELLNGTFQKCQKDISGDAVSTGTEVSEGHTNNTDISDTEFSENQSIIYQEPQWMENDTAEYEAYRVYFEEQLSFEQLVQEFPFDKDSLYEILELLVETVCSNRKFIRIAGDDKPIQIVKSRLLKLNSEHIRYVLKCMKDTTSRIRNIRQYLLAALYNAPATISNYYSALVNHDMYGGG